MELPKTSYSYWSRRTVLFLILFYGLVSSTAHRVWQGETQVVEWDGYGYYAYLPAVFIYGTADDYAFVDRHFEQYAFSANVYQVRSAPNGRLFPIYNLGLALLWLPFFLLAHAYCLIFGGYEPDGMSLPYQLSLWAAAFFYLSLGWWYLARFLRRHLSDRATACTLLLVGLGTNLFYYGYRELELTHLYLFALYAAFLFYLQRYHDRDRPWRGLLIPGLLAGLMILIRSSEVVIFFLAAGWGWNWRWSTFRRNFSTSIALVGLAIPVFALQLLYYKISLGYWWVNGYGGHHFDWTSPHLYECLIGYRRGWLIYTPLALFMLIGIGQLLRERNRWGWSILAFTFFNCWLLFSWHLWNYGSTFGSRPVVQSYAVLALPLGLLSWRLWQAGGKVRIPSRLPTRGSTKREITKPRFVNVPRLFLGTSAGLIIALNLFQTWQFEKRIIPLDLNNHTHYWHNFLTTELDRHSYRFLYTNEKLPKRANYDWQLLAQSDSSFLMPGRGENHQEYFTHHRQVFDSLSAQQFSESWTRSQIDLTYLEEPNEWEYQPVLIFEVKRGEEMVKWTRIYIPPIINDPVRDTLEIDLQLPPLQAEDVWQIYQWNPSADSLVMRGHRVSVLK